MATYYKTFFQHFHINFLSNDQRALLVTLMEEAYNAEQLNPYKERGVPAEEYKKFNIGNCLKVFSYCEAVTVCIIEDKDKNVVAKGYAFFVPPLAEDKTSNPAQRQFNKPEGRRISLRKAKKAMGKAGLLEDAKFVLRWSDLKNKENKNVTS